MGVRPRWTSCCGHVRTSTTCPACCSLAGRATPALPSSNCRCARRPAGAQPAPARRLPVASIMEVVRLLTWRKCCESYKFCQYPDSSTGFKTDSTPSARLKYSVYINLQDVFRRLNGCNRLRRYFFINLISIKIGRIYGYVLQNCRISHESSTINICDVNAMAPAACAVLRDQNVTSSVF